MDVFEMIPPATKNMVQIFAVQGKSLDEIGFLTHMDQAAIERILAEPVTVELQTLLNGMTVPLEWAVNTTPDAK